MANPKQHHYVPAFYLSNFTNEQAKNGTLWVWEKDLKKPRKSKPEKEARQNKLNSIEGAKDPLAVEKAFDFLETDAAPILRNIIASGAFPDDYELGIIQFFIAIQFTRTVAFRKMLGHSVDKLRKQVWKHKLQDPDEWEKFRSGLEKGGTKLSQQEMLDMLDTRIKFEPSQNWYLHKMIELAWPIFEVLSRRNWAIVKFDSEETLICSDNPVCLIWSDPKNHGKPIGFGLKGTEVVVPICPKLALLAVYEAIPKIIKLPDDGVENTNGIVYTQAHRFIYSQSNKTPRLKYRKSS